MASRVLAFAQVSSHQGLRQPKKAEKASGYEHQRHKLIFCSVQSDQASFQDCPWRLVVG